MDVLIVRLRSSGFGCYLFGVHFGCLMFADDCQWSNCGERGGTAFPLTATYNTSNRKKCALNA